MESLPAHVTTSIARPKETVQEICRPLAGTDGTLDISVAIARVVVGTGQEHAGKLLHLMVGVPHPGARQDARGKV